MNGNATIQNKLAAWRSIAFAAAIAAVFGFYLLRLFNLQIIQKSEWLAQADTNRTSEINIPAPRGIIYDRNGVILAQNIPSYNIVVTAAYLPDDTGPMESMLTSGEVQEIMRQLSLLTGVPINRGELSEADPFVECKSDHGIAQTIEFGITSRPYQPVPIKCNVSRQVAMVVQEKAVDWPGVGVEVVPVRDYPTGELTANAIGYLGPIPPDTKAYYETRNFVVNRDKIGYAGVEAWFQDTLAGRNGLRKVEVDAAGQIYADIAEPQPVIPGQNIRLTLDYRLQQAAYAILIDEIDSWNRIVIPDKLMTSGVVIAMNPKTGEILAMVSYPTYENNRMAREIPEYYYIQLIADQRLPLLNHAVGDQLPVGSVFKLVTATGALNEGVVAVDQLIDAPPVLKVTEKFYVNDPGQAREFIEWNYKTLGDEGGFGKLTPVQAIAQSCNVCFYKMGGGYQDEIAGDGLGICRLGTYARALGYGPVPAIELPDATDGLIPDPTWKRINRGESWSTGDTYIASVGQGFIIGTPLQVLMSAATIANDGKLMEPTILKEMLDDEGTVTQPFEAKMRWDLTKDPMIDVFASQSIRGCEPTGEKKIIEPWVFQAVQEGMRLAVVEGTLSTSNIGFQKLNIAVAGKTGTAEYCDKFVRPKGLCVYGNWPTHAWTIAYAPFDDPEIAVVAFVYNGNEGSTVAGPIVRRVLQAYFELKAVDNALGRP